MKQLMIICLFSVSAVAQSDDALVKVRVPAVKARFGHAGSIEIFVSVKNGYHIQANQTKDELIIPTTLEIAEDETFKTNEQVFPSAKKFTLAGTDQYLEVYDGDFLIQTSFTMSEPGERGIRQLKGTLTYQACDSVRCLFPRTVDFFVSIEIQ